MPDIKSSNRAADIRRMYAADEEESVTPGERGVAAPAPGVASVPMAPKKKSKAGKVFLTLLLIVVLVLVLLFIISKTINWNTLGLSKAPAVGPAGQPIAKASDWQAVFLTNGQVYFGQLKSVNNPYPVLEDIYYLQVQSVPIQPAEPASTEEGGVQPAEQAQQQLILVKFGTELHRPVDRMYLNKDHIMFFEDMSQESNVVQAIERYKAGQ